MRELPLRLDSHFGDIELSYWPDLFDSPACKVTRAEDGSYFLTACRCENLSDYNEVLESANKLKTMMMAISKIELGIDSPRSKRNDNGDIRSIRDRIDESSVNIHSHEIMKTLVVETSTVKISTEILDQEGNVAPQKRQERWYDYFLDQCDGWIDNTTVFAALSYFAQKTEARTVRLTYDTIRHDEGGQDLLLKNNNWVNRTELSRFTCSFNRSDIDSPELHIKKIASPNCNMSISEARTFLAERLLKPWLIKKRERYKLDDGIAVAKYLYHMLGI